jgi:quinolinate synthase
MKGHIMNMNEMYSKETLSDKHLTEEYFESKFRYSKDETYQRIKALKKQLGNRLAIAAHFYQRDEIMQFGDFTGDSLKLVKTIKNNKDVEFIIFCGVHFMAEVADILTGVNQKVYLPNLTAGCAMSDTAPVTQVKQAFLEMETILGKKPAVPITYINSSAAIKAFCGENDGTVCTSSNAEKILTWGLSQNKPVFFLPDKNLGANTALKLEVAKSQIVTWYHDKPMGGLTKEELKNARVILWNGHCYVHSVFNKYHLAEKKNQHPDTQIIVHPECTPEVVELSDANGSTQFILDTIDAAPSGSNFTVGTEKTMVERLAKQHKQRGVIVNNLFDKALPCSTMYRTHPDDLLQTLEEIVKNQSKHQIVVSEKETENAKLALTRMLELC